MVITKSNINNTESFGNIAESGTHTHFSPLPARLEFRRSTSAKEGAQRWFDFPESQPSFYERPQPSTQHIQQPHPPAALREPRGSEDRGAKEKPSPPQALTVRTLANSHIHPVAPEQ